MAQLYPLTYSQKSIWYTEKIYPETSLGIVAGTFRFKDNIDYTVLEKAINIFVKNNEALRTRIVEENGEVNQYYAPYEPFDVELKDFSNADSNVLYDWEVEQTRIPFKLVNSQLFEFTMMKVSDNEGGYLIKMHHLISDAWSMTIVGNSIMSNYLAILNNTEYDIDKPTYAEYIKNYDEYKNSEKFKKDHEYWVNKYDVAPEVTTLKPRTTKENSIASNRKTFVLPEKLCKKMYEYSSENKVSIFAMYMTALSMYMHRVTGKEKLNLGTILLNRSNRAEKNTMGMFVETLPVALDINGTDNFNDLSKNVTMDMMGVMRHHKYPFELIQEELRHKYNFDDVLYDIVLSYQNAKFLDKNAEIDFKTRWHFAGYQSNALTIHINDRESENKLIIDYDYITELFYDKEIDFLHDHIIRLLWHALDNPVKELNKLEMVSETEKQKILVDFNQTETDYPKDKVVHQIIEETAKRLNDKVAVISNGESITYGELNRRANIVANKLRESGIKPNDMVGLLINRSVNMMVGLLGIMKSGAAYLPIDPEYPEERINYMLTDSKAKFLLTEESMNELIKNFDVSKDYIEKDFVSGNEENPSIVNTPEDLVYVIYTSGSTGNPKGVMLKHKNINNFVKGTTDVIDFNESKTIVSVTTICFDIFVLESWLSLQKGLTIVLATEEEQNSPRLFNELCLKYNVSMLQTTPSRTDLLTNNSKFIEYVKNITDFMVGGEPFPETLLTNLKKISNANIYNMYGPTETAVWSSIKDLTKEEKINIGHPMANTEFYILDKTLNLCPIGMIGDLYIGGEGLARGYFGKEELTAEKFIQNPYKENDIIYNTGDLARWMGNGEVCHMGRSDFQVKIRGYRIELGDIQKNLINIDGVENAVIKAVDNKYLIAYLICDENISVTEIKSQLSKALPQYMIPSYFVRLEEFPHTPNGKVDSKRLPDLSQVEIMREEFVEPSTDMQKELAEIWSNLLNIQKVSIKDDFFDIGGDSLGAINLANEISEKYNVTMAVKEIYDNNTIEKMEKYLSNLELNTDDNIINRNKNIVLLKKSESNENMFFIHAGNGTVLPYARLCSQIERDINCYGIPFYMADNIFYPMHVNLEELTKEYVKIIREIQPHGPYKLFGWCVGCSIIFEMIKKFEELGEEVDEIYLEAGLAPNLGRPRPIFNRKEEVTLIKLFVTSDDLLNEILKGNNEKEVWNILLNKIDLLESYKEQIKYVLEQAMLPVELDRATPNYKNADLKTIINMFNMIRTLATMYTYYEPKHTSTIKAYYFNPMQDMVLGNQEENKNAWKKCMPNIEFINIDGDHFSFHEKETDALFVEKFNQLLNHKGGK